MNFAPDPTRLGSVGYPFRKTAGTLLSRATVIRFGKNKTILPVKCHLNFTYYSLLLQLFFFDFIRYVVFDGHFACSVLLQFPFPILLSIYNIIFC